MSTMMESECLFDYQEEAHLKSKVEFIEEFHFALSRVLLLILQMVVAVSLCYLSSDMRNYLYFIFGLFTLDDQQLYCFLNRT